MISKIFKSILLINVIILITAYVSGQNNISQSPSQDSIIILDIQNSIQYQTMDNFGASDAWSIQFVGNWPDIKRNKIADLLFTKELDQRGSPKGIGLSLWRFNVGAGSTEQGDESQITDEWHRGESFLKLNGKYDWTRNKGQMWMAQAARSRGVENLLIFSNSPHVNFTRNGIAHSTNPMHSNIEENKYDEFATYLAKVTMYLNERGLSIDYISPVNEPQWDWADKKQEGTPMWNHEIAGIAKALNVELKENELDVKIDIPETAQIEYLYKEMNKKGRSNQIYAFFNPNSPNYIGDLSHISHTVSGHSYFSTYPYSSMVEKRKSLTQTMENYRGLNYWMSEYCILENNEEIKGKGVDLGMDAALYMAKVIHTDLTAANASAWHWWLAVSPYDYKDGLIYIEKNKKDGYFYESKMLWTLGNYSRFIRPGFVRISVEPTISNEEFLVSGYQDPKSDQKIIVIVNSNNNDILTKLNVEDNITSIKGYITSQDQDLEKTDFEVGKMIQIPRKSITTLVIN